MRLLLSLRVPHASDMLISAMSDLAPTDTQPASDRSGALGVHVASSPRQSLYPLLVVFAITNLLCIAVLWTHRSRAPIDYRSFYAAGHIARVAPQRTYEATAQREEQLREFPGQDRWIPFLHPPMELALFAPLSRLPYQTSLAVWTSFSVALLLVVPLLLSQVTGLRYWQILLLAGAMISTSYALFQGQDSIVLLFLVSATLLLATRNQDALAGIVLSAALFKPQVPIVIALALFLAGRRRLFIGFCSSAAAIGILSFAFLGKVGLHGMYTMARFQEPHDEIWKMPCIRGLLSFVHAPSLVAIICSLALLAVFAMRWSRSPGNILPVCSSAILVGALTAFHFHAYDLSLVLIPACLLLATPASRTQLAALSTLAAAPIFFVLFWYGYDALLAIPVLVLAICQELAATPSFPPRTEPCPSGSIAYGNLHN